MNYETRNNVTRITLLSAFVLLALPALAGAHPACHDATWIEPGEVVRGLGQAAGGPSCYWIATPEAGLLMLDVTVPAAADVEPLLTLADGCGADAGLGKARRLSSLAATPSQRLVRVAGGRDYLVCVGAGDPLLRLDDYRLETAFLAVAKDEPVEVEPEGFGMSGCGWREKDEPVEVEPEGFGTAGCAKDEPVEVEPEGLTLRPGVRSALCRQARRDEHADVFACATALDLGRGGAGEIANPWGDDQDVFAFELTAPETVRFWLSGETETVIGLFDARGQRLALAGAAAAGASTQRRVKTLGPGIYFVRVQGWQGAEGAYELEVSRVARSW